jgi:hypothetical protein
MEAWTTDPTLKVGVTSQKPPTQTESSDQDWLAELRGGIDAPGKYLAYREPDGNVVAFALAFRNHQPEEEADLRARRAERRHARSRASPEPSDSSSPSSSGTLQPR